MNMHTYNVITHNEYNKFIHILYSVCVCLGFFI